MEIGDRHSLVTIKDTFSGQASRFLLYYDRRWDCWLFPNRPTVENDIDSVVSMVCSGLKVSRDDVVVTKLAQRIQRKYSYSHGHMRTYAHTLYTADVSNFPAAARSETFTMDGIKYRWMTIDAMMNDAVIVERNADVVRLVDELAH